MLILDALASFDIDKIFGYIIGPYGALALLIIIMIFLYRENRELRTLLATNQSLFAAALKVIKEDLIPLVQREHYR